MKKHFYDNTGLQKMFFLFTKAKNITVQVSLWKMVILHSQVIKISISHLGDNIQVISSS